LSNAFIFMRAYAANAGVREKFFSTGGNSPVRSGFDYSEWR
jgi:hypothetical protein